MFIIHPTTEAASNLYHETLRFCQEMNLTPLEFEDCFQVIRAILDDQLSHRFKWCPAQTTIRQLLETLTGWHTLEIESLLMGERVPLYDHYYETVLLEYVVDVERWLDAYVPSRTWDVWYLTNFGRELVIDKGTDYRVMDWHRRMQSGEWR